MQAAAPARAADHRQRGVRLPGDAALLGGTRQSCDRRHSGVRKLEATIHVLLKYTLSSVKQVIYWQWPMAFKQSTIMFLDFDFNPFAALGRLTYQNIDKQLSTYSKSGINLIIMDRKL